MSWIKLSFNFWRNWPPFYKRMLTIAIFFAISVIVTLIGTAIPLSAEEAESINATYSNQSERILNAPFLNQVTAIFGNNLFICLLAFIPIIGAILQFYILLSTGVVIAATSYGVANPSIIFLILLVYPFAWMEFLAYSIGLSEGGWLFWRAIKRRGKSELVNACKFITVCVLLLLSAAIIEAVMIASMSGG